MGRIGCTFFGAAMILEFAYVGLVFDQRPPEKCRTSSASLDAKVLLPIANLIAYYACAHLKVGNYENKNSKKMNTIESREKS